MMSFWGNICMPPTHTISVAKTEDEANANASTTVFRLRIIFFLFLVKWLSFNDRVPPGVQPRTTSTIQNESPRCLDAPKRIYHPPNRNVWLNEKRRGRNYPPINTRFFSVGAG